LPTRVRQRYHAVLKEFSARPEVLASSRRALARFFRKYPDQTCSQKDAARFARIAASSLAAVETRPPRTCLKARDLLLRHSVTTPFARTYSVGSCPASPTDPWRNLIRAESLADLHTPGALMARVELLDYDADGAGELLFTAPEYQALLNPAMADHRPRSISGLRCRDARKLHSTPRPSHQRTLREGCGKVCHGWGRFHSRRTVSMEARPGRFLALTYRGPARVSRFCLFRSSARTTIYELSLQEDAMVFAGGPLL